MNITHRELQYILISHVEALKDPTRKECPSISDIVQLKGRKFFIRKLDNYSEHFQSCPYCLKELKLILNLQLETASFIKDINYFYRNKEKTSSIFLNNVNRYVLPLLGFCAITFCFLILFTFNFIDNPMRAPTNIHLFEKWKIFEPYGKTNISSLSVFRWEYYGNAMYFIIQLFDGSFSSIWESDPLFSRSTKIPKDIIAKIHPGIPYFWLIYAYDKYKKIIESDIIEFEILHFNENKSQTRNPPIK